MIQQERGIEEVWGSGRFASVVLAVIALTLPASVRAQTLLRWKLKPGDEFVVEMQQETESQVAFSGKSAATKIDLTSQLGWKVTAADVGQITLRQQVQRILIALA